MNDYDIIVVGTGLYGATFAQQAKENGYKVLLIDKRNHIGGNVYTKEYKGINIHCYGAHIFHTSNENVWNYVKRFTAFNNFINEPMARYRNVYYHLPFNMNTFYVLYGEKSPKIVKEIISKEIKQENISEPTNLEEQALSLVGRKTYEVLIKGYTEKQWGRDCKDLPSSIIKRIPIRYTFDNNYFNDKYQGIPICGYTKMIERMIDGIDLKLNYDYFDHVKEIKKHCKFLVYTGPIDEFYSFKYGALEYRSLRFENEEYQVESFQQSAVVNYTERRIPYTRIIEHKKFEQAKTSFTVITKEYPAKFSRNNEPYYPINDEKNTSIYKNYESLAKKEKGVIFGGRLANYKYFDMDDTIEKALLDFKEFIQNEK